MARRKIKLPHTAFFIVRNGIPNTTLGFSEHQGVLFGGIITALNDLTSAEVGIGRLDVVEAEEGHIITTSVPDGSIIGFFLKGKKLGPTLIKSIRDLTTILGIHFWNQYSLSKQFQENLEHGTLPDRYQIEIAYNAVRIWRKNQIDFPFQETNDLERYIRGLNEKIIEEINANIDITELIFPKKYLYLEDYLYNAIFKHYLKEDVSPLLVAKNIEVLPYILRSQVKLILGKYMKINSPLTVFKELISQHVEAVQW